MQYWIEIQNVVNSALTELAEQHQTGKLANTPVTNTHFMARWITRALKSQRFHACVKNDLISWQKLSRSQGTNSGLVTTFEKIAQLYARFVPVDGQPQVVTDKQIEAFMDHMESVGWEVVNEFELTEKTQIFADQANSFVLCALQCEQCFTGSDLTKPMSFYVRGSHAEFVKHAVEQGFLLHKQTDYKSIVKYHGEYVVYPNNQGNKLAEIPLQLD